MAQSVGLDTLSIMKFALDHAKGNRQVMPNHPYPSIEKDFVLKQDGAISIQNVELLKVSKKLIFWVLKNLSKAIIWREPSLALLLDILGKNESFKN